LGLIFLSIIIAIALMFGCTLFWWHYLGDIKGWNWVATYQGGIVFGILSGVMLSIGIYYLEKIMQ
jgi:hypothetical protein